MKTAVEEEARREGRGNDLYDQQRAINRAIKMGGATHDEKKKFQLKDREV